MSTVTVDEQPINVLIAEVANRHSAIMLISFPFYQPGAPIYSVAIIDGNNHEACMLREEAAIIKHF